MKAGMDHLRESTVKPHDSMVSFHWHVLPHQIAGTLLNRCCGVGSSYEENEAGKARNTIVGLIQVGEPAPHRDT
ncbi:MAG TPA: hypothetical protein EYP19_03860 [Desulfobacterales bacterium]|nr:hypothetical protein [Desulfobacterales bacterium]